MPKGPDPRKEAAPPSAVPGLLRQGAREWSERRFWHAHEAWEGAWHALRASGDAEAAEFVHGLILCAAGLENATRGKEGGFKRQFAEGLYLLRANAGGAARAGVDAGVPDALALLYVDACRRLDWAAWNASGWQAPEVRLA